MTKTNLQKKRATARQGQPLMVFPEIETEFNSLFRNYFSVFFSI